MNYSIFISNEFKKEFKPLLKKYPSLKNDLELLLNDLKNNPKLGTNLEGGLRKIRFIIKSKGKGSSGGARVITYETIISLNESLITLLSIYDKSDYDTINIAVLKKNLNLE